MGQWLKKYIEPEPEPELTVDTVLEQTLKGTLTRCVLIPCLQPYDSVLGTSIWIVPSNIIAVRYRQREPEILIFSQQEFSRLMEVAAEGMEALDTVIKAKRLLHGIIRS